MTEQASVSTQAARIVCIGGVNIDRKLQTLQPLQYATSNPATTTQTYGGVARNIAENLAHLDLWPALITVVGDDQEGEALLRHCASCNIDIHPVLHLPGSTTGTYTAILDHTGKMILALADMRICEQFTAEKLQSRWPFIASSSIVVADTNLPAETLAYLLEHAKMDHVPVCVVSVSRPKLLHLPPRLDDIFLFMLNRDEAEALAALSLQDEQRVQRACEIIARRGAHNIVVTLGSQGAFWWQEDGSCGRVTTESVSIVDETGAGDAFTSGVLYALQSDPANFARACWLGIKLATITLQTQKSVSDKLSSQLAQRWLLAWEEIQKEEHT